MKKIFMLAAIIVMGISMQAHAALELRGTDSLGNRLIYDDDLDVTWYDYTNIAKWYFQAPWASGLSIDFGGTIYDDWRLPTTSGFCEGYCTNSELGSLYYTGLGNSAGGPLTNTGDFQNLQPAYYWSGTEYPSEYGGYAWAFNFKFGYQFGSFESQSRPAMAVRDGDVAVAPEPISSTLFIVGGAALGFRRFVRRRTAV